MVNQNYEELVQNNNRGAYLKSKNQNKRSNSKENNRTIPQGPILRNQK